MEPKLTLPCELRVEDVDITSRLSATGLMTLFQRMATLHATQLMVDHETMRREHNAYFVVTKLRLRFLAGVAFGQSVEATTWPLPPGRATLCRQMTVTADGILAAAVASEWCVLDWDTHRLRRADSSGFPTHLQFCTDWSLAGEFTRLSRDTAGMEFCFSHTLRYSDLDMNRHTNNVVYARLAVDTFSAEELIAHPVEEMELHFLKESREGETLCLYRQDAGGMVRVVGTRGEGGEPVFVAGIGRG